MPRGENRSDRELKEDLRERIKEIEARLKRMDRRDKLLGDLKKWLATRKLDHKDMWWMYRQMMPKRASAPVKSKNPLQPASKASGKTNKMPIKGDPEFMRAIREAREEKQLRHEDVATKVGVSGASIANWEQGRYVPKEEARQKLVKFLGLPGDLGAERTRTMMMTMGSHKNGATVD
jgi:DNA-binding transcriptional regulator YiaG